MSFSNNKFNFDHLRRAGFNLFHAWETHRHAWNVRKTTFADQILEYRTSWMRVSSIRFFFLLCSCWMLNIKWNHSAGMFTRRMKSTLTVFKYSGQDHCWSFGKIRPCYIPSSYISFMSVVSDRIRSFILSRNRLAANWSGSAGWLWKLVAHEFINDPGVCLYTTIALDALPIFVRCYCFVAFNYIFLMH